MRFSDDEGNGLLRFARNDAARFTKRKPKRKERQIECLSLPRLEGRSSFEGEPSLLT